MRLFTLPLMIAAALVIADHSAFGQQDCDCDRGGSMSDSIYQPTQWNECQSCDRRNGHGNSRRRQARNSRERGSSRLASLWTRPLFPRSCAARCCATKGFPDAGWNAPAHMPVNYDGAWYGSYLPQNAYGTPGGGFVANYPSVYQPTDTTQLGYYYNKVPTWQTRSDMIPPTPRPGNFHSRVQPQNCYGYNSYQGVSYAPAPASCQSCNRGH